MSEYIRRQDAVGALGVKPTVLCEFDDYAQGRQNQWTDARKAIESLETADVVPLSAYKQVMWERDTAVEQLNQIGKSFGEVMDDVAPVVRCKDCKFYTSMRPDLKTGICDLNVHHMGDDGFCSYGERREEQNV